MAVLAATWLFISAIITLALMQSDLNFYLALAIDLIICLCGLLFTIALYHAVLEENGVWLDMALPKGETNATELRDGIQRLRVRRMEEAL